MKFPTKMNTMHAAVAKYNSPAGYPLKSAAVDDTDDEPTPTAQTNTVKAQKRCKKLRLMEF